MFCLILIIIILSSNLVLGAQTSYNNCIPKTSIDPNVNQLSFSSIQGVKLTGIDANGWSWQLGVCGQSGTKCDDGIIGMLTQQNPNSGECYALGEVTSQSTWSKSKPSGEGNFVLTTVLSGASSTDGCNPMIGQFRQTELEFVCDEEAVDSSTMSFTVTPPSQGVTYCGTYHVKLKTCYACANAKFGKCPRKSPSDPNVDPSKNVVDSKNKTNHYNPWFDFVIVFVVVVVISVAGYYAYRKEIIYGSAQNNDDSTQHYISMDKNSEETAEYSPPKIEEDV